MTALKNTEDKVVSINRFNFVQMFNNSKGKTSPMLVIAFWGGVISLLVFLVTSFITLIMVTHGTKADVTSILTNTQMQSVALFTVASGMLVTRRFTNDKEIQQ